MVDELVEILAEPVTCEDGKSHYIDENNRRYLASIIRKAVETERLDRPELREKIARITCCFAKLNKSCAECLETIPAFPFPDCYSDMREETDQLLALIPDEKVVVEEIKGELEMLLGYPNSNKPVQFSVVISGWWEEFWKEYLGKILRRS